MAAVRYHDGKFPPKDLDWGRLIPLVGPANAAVARYDGVLEGVPNPRVMLSPLTTQEAVLSSKIEGTQATMGEVLEYEAGAAPANQDPEKVRDIQEILNYRKAIRQAEKDLGRMPLAGRMIREAHTVLMDGVRGRTKRPGEYRREQNWIGSTRNIEEARFVPIEWEKLEEGMAAWERYVHSEERDLLVQLAIAHAEFEALHPFLDGNGRLGRLLIPLYLFDRKMLSTPTFYLSAYLESNREEYCERLLAVSRDGDWTGWCEFFLRAVLSQAQSNTTKARQVVSLYNQKKRWITEKTHSEYSIQALDFFFDRPVFSSVDFAAGSRIPGNTARRILGMLRDSGMLVSVKERSGRRAAVYAFAELLNLAEGRKVI